MAGLLLALSALTPAQADPAIGSTVVVVVRHAEKATDDPRDPSLSVEGLARADALAARLASAGLDVAYSTQYRRTQMTAAPAAKQAGIEVIVRPIDAANAGTYAAELARDLHALPAGSTTLVVGHSNTAPAMVAALSGQAEVEMPETEFDRYTVVVLDTNGGARVFTSRY